jgi:hypothetical protein
MFEGYGKVSLAVGAALGMVGSVFLSLIVLSFFPTAESILPARTYEFIKDILGPVAAGFGGAIAGVLTSHHIQTKVEARKAESQALAEARKAEAEALSVERTAEVNKVSDYNKGIGILISKYRDIATIKRQVVMTSKNDPLRFLTMPISQDIPENQLRASDHLGKLLIEQGMGDVLSKLMVLEQKYVAAMYGVRERNRTVLPYRAEFDAALPRDQFRRSAGLSDVIWVHGCTRLLRLYSFSEGFISMIDDTLISFDNTLIELQVIFSGKFKFPDLNIIDYQNDGTALEPTPPPFYKTVDELAFAIGDDYSRSLARRDWRACRGGYTSATVKNTFGDES